MLHKVGYMSEVYFYTSGIYHQNKYIWNTDKE